MFRAGPRTAPYPRKTKRILRERPLCVRSVTIRGGGLRSEGEDPVEKLVDNLGERVLPLFEELSKAFRGVESRGFEHAFEEVAAGLADDGRRPDTKGLHDLQALEGELF